MARMRVPGDLFNGKAPEAKAAEVLSTVFTAVALRVVLAQVGGGGEGGDLPPTPEFAFLRDHLGAHPLKSDGDAWLAHLMAQERGQMLSVRILEVRAAYCAADFDWARCRQLAEAGVREANVRLLRDHASRAFGGALRPDGQPGDSGGPT